METKESGSGKAPKVGLAFGNKELQLLREHARNVWIRISYDLLEVPALPELEEDKEVDEIVQPPKLEPVIETHTGLSRPTPVESRKPKKRRNEFGRGIVMNPAPNAKSFKPDWYDRISGVEFSLAQGPLVEDKKRRDPKCILFWTRTTGKNSKGDDKMLPQVHEFVELVDLRTGQHVGRGRIAERFITAKRTMGYVAITSLLWDPEAPFYFS